MMPRLVRKRPLLARIRDFFNPADWLLWVSEELETRDWDSTRHSELVAALLHFLTLISQANVSRSVGPESDVFNDRLSESGWVNSMAILTVYFLSTLSILNALYTFSRKRSYRLFENSIDKTPPTSSAQRVRVDSSPLSSSPLRIFNHLLGSMIAESADHPNPTCHVWEIATWDPLPICLRLFCLYSPGHVLVYWLFLPTKPLDPRPSVTVSKTILLQILMTVQLLLLQSRFAQQIKDSAILNEEVMKEYDIKYVHHRLNPLMRDVGTQYASSGSDGSSKKQCSVTVYNPSFIIKRGFRPNPNPNYAKYFDPDNLSTSNQRHDVSTPNSTPSTPSLRSTKLSSESSSNGAYRQPQSHRAITTATSTSSMSRSDGGGSLGIYSHANSPLRKATSLYNVKQDERETPKNSLSMASRERREHNDSRKNYSGKSHPYHHNNDQDTVSNRINLSNHNNSQAVGNEDRWTSSIMTSNNTPTALKFKPKLSLNRLSRRTPKY